MKAVGEFDSDRPASGSLAGGRAVRDEWYPSSKAVLDLITAVALLGLLWPLILLLMGLVRLTSKGPALYTQVRLGIDGRPYAIYKLRTMVHDCERFSGPRWSTPGDSRVTRLGRLLRRTHLDELPQLWNVVRGEMSLVGPRPERPEFVTQLERVIPEYRERLLVRPGITGLAQIQAPPDEDFAGVRRKVAYDRYYVERVGPWLDLRILMGTALKVFGVSFTAIRKSLALPGPQVDPGDADDRNQAVRSKAGDVFHPLVRVPS
jgi:lipopolysaccharide/colanic/teichoic acid biosynthesis glycosyltransferase